MKQINASDLTDGLFKWKANKQSQRDHHEANNFYCVFSPNKANGEIYWTFDISEIDGSWKVWDMWSLAISDHKSKATFLWILGTFNWAILTYSGNCVFRWWNSWKRPHRERDRRLRKSWNAWSIGPPSEWSHFCAGPLRKQPEDPRPRRKSLHDAPRPSLFFFASYFISTIAIDFAISSTENRNKWEERESYQYLEQRRPGMLLKDMRIRSHFAGCCPSHGRAIWRVVHGCRSRVMEIIT